MDLSCINIRYPEVLNVTSYQEKQAEKPKSRFTLTRNEWIFLKSDRIGRYHENLKISVQHQLVSINNFKIVFEYYVINEAPWRCSGFHFHLTAKSCWFKSHWVHSVWSYHVLLVYGRVSLSTLTFSHSTKTHFIG